jgi:sec-independent protein translocase protein TatA
MGLDNPIHILFLLILLLLVFGAKRLPEMGRSLGTGLRGFRDSLSGAGLRGSDVAPAARAAPSPQAVTVPAEAPTVPAASARNVNSEHPGIVGGRE